MFNLNYEFYLGAVSRAKNATRFCDREYRKATKGSTHSRVMKEMRDSNYILYSEAKHNFLMYCELNKVSAATGQPLLPPRYCHRNDFGSTKLKNPFNIVFT